MDQRYGQAEREISLRKYFMVPPVKPSPGCLAIGLLVLGAIFTLATLSVAFSEKAGAEGLAVLLPGLILIGAGVLIIRSKNSAYAKRVQEGEPKPSDSEVEQWLREGIQKLVQHSAQALSLSQEEGMFAEPIVVAGPILWRTNGISDWDLLWKKGTDGIVRFGVYRVTIIRLTDRHLGSFACDYNFIKDVPLNEKTDEYHYRDVVAVSTREQATSFTAKSTKGTSDRNLAKRGRLKAG